MGWTNKNKTEYNYEGALSFKETSKYTVRLLQGDENAPVYPWVHNVPQSLNVNGGFTTVLCSGVGTCPLCAVNASPRYKDRPNTASPTNPVAKPYPKSTIVAMPVFVKEKGDVFLITMKGIVKQIELWETNGKKIFNFWISAIKGTNNGQTAYSAVDLDPEPFNEKVNQERLKSLIPGYMAFLANNMSQVKVLKDTDPEWFPSSAPATAKETATKSETTVATPQTPAPATPAAPAAPAISPERTALNKRWVEVFQKPPMKAALIGKLLTKYKVADTDEMNDKDFESFISEYEKS